MNKYFLIFIFIVIICIFLFTQNNFEPFNKIPFRDKLYEKTTPELLEKYPDYYHGKDVIFDADYSSGFEVSYLSDSKHKNKIWLDYAKNINVCNAPKEKQKISDYRTYRVQVFGRYEYNPRKIQPEKKIYGYGPNRFRPSVGIDRVSRDQISRSDICSAGHLGAYQSKLTADRIIYRYTIFS